MNGKPVTSRALRLAALHCTHPALDGADKAILTCLVENGDHGTGENCRPGNRNLMDAVRLTKRPLDARIDRLIAAGLINRTERGDGRGRASVYRILWCSNHYPDQTPNGEWLINKPGCVDSQDCKNEPGCVGSHDSSGTGLADGTTGLFAESKPSCATVETGRSRQPHTKNPPEKYRPLTTTQNGGGKSLEEKHPRIAFGKRTDLEALISEHGFSTVARLLAECDEESFEGVNNPVAAVFRHRLPKKLAEAKAAHADAARKAQEQAIVDAGVARQIEEHKQEWNRPVVERGEILEDFLKG